MRTALLQIYNLARAWRCFASARGGNVAITFALTLIPIMGMVGAAVDYSHANSVKAAMQAALDFAALMLSKEATSDTSSQLQTNAQKYFNALFTKPEATGVTVSATYTSSGGSQVLVSGSANVPTSFLGVIGYHDIAVNATSTAKWGSSRLRVALVLDNTGSMADAGKIGALKTATNNLLSQLQTAASTNGDVYVSIIPFVKDVNLDGANYTSNWIYWGTLAQDSTLSDNTSWDAINGTCSLSGYSPRSQCVSKSSCSISGYTTQSSCTAAGTCSLSGNSTQSSCTSAGTCSIGGYTTQSSCTAGSCSISGHSTQSSCTSAGICSNPGETTQSSCTGNKACTKSQYTSKNPCQTNNGTWGFGTWTTGTWTAGGTWTTGTWTTGVWTQATWTPDNHNTWNGCVVDRGDPGAPNSSNYDTNVVAPSTTIPATLYAAEQSPYCSTLQPVMGLNYNWSAMNTLVNNMSPNGSTNQAIGLQLGWMSLVGGGPFSVPAMDPNYTYQQTIILLTDGLNTQDRWYGNGSSLGTSDDAKIDARQQLTCNNIKAANITLYTIQVNTGGDPTSTLLQNCASNSTKFFLLTSANEIVTTFNAIGTNLTKLRVAQVTAANSKKPGHNSRAFICFTLTKLYATLVRNALRYATYFAFVIRVSNGL